MKPQYQSDPFPYSDPDAAEVLGRVTDALLQYRILPWGKIVDMISLFDFFSSLDLGEAFNHGQFHPRTCFANHCMWSE